MDLGIVVGIAMIAVWAVATFVYEAPGWIHLLLSAGLFVVMWRIVVRGTRRGVPHADAPASRKDARDTRGAARRKR